MPDWVIRMEHIPTGVVLYADSQCFRSEEEAKRSLVSRMKARLYMIDRVDIAPDNVTIEYE